MNTAYSYDRQNRLTSLQTVCDTIATGCTPGQPLAGYSYTLGAAGNRLSVQERSGTTVQYGYDNLYRLTSEIIAEAASQNGTIAYQYDPVGNRRQLISAVPAIPPTGLLSYDANDHAISLPYDSNGNLLLGAAGANVYDFENRAVQAGKVKIVYDGDGSQMEEIAAGTNDLPDIIQKLNGE
jgi:YD repeat-containing protein